MLAWLCAGVGLALCALLCGCATIFTGTHDEMTFEANVPGVRLTIDGQFQGQLPLKIDMSRNFFGGHHFMAKFEADGYQTQEFKLNTAFNGVAVLDITSIPTSGGIDLLTGSLFLFSPTEYRIQMLKVGETAASVEYERSLDAYRFGLTNSAAIQRDVARGGGAYLTNFAWLLSRGEEGAQGRIVAESIRHRDSLVVGDDPRLFVRRYGDMVSQSRDLGAFGL